MKSRLLAAAAVSAVAIAACHHEPPEPMKLDAAGSRPAATAPQPPTFDGAADDGAPPDAGAADGGTRAAIHDFCSGAFSADEDRMRERCSKDDLQLTQSMGRAAANVCAADFATALGRHRAAFDADAARRCVEMLRQKGLAQTSETDTLYQHFPCDRVLLGLQAEGQPCLFSIECKDGLACVGYRIGVDGTCKKPPAAKEACTLQPYGSLVNEAASAQHHPACAATDYCDGTTCRPRVQPGKPCSKSEMCRPGLSCVTGKCGLRAGTGAACASTEDCAFGLWCDHAGATGGRCAPKRGDGEECTSQEACKGRCDIPKKRDGRPGDAGKCQAVCGSG